MALELCLKLGKQYTHVFNAPDVTAEKLAQLYAKDARYFAPGKPAIVGRNNLVKAMQDVLGVGEHPRLEMTADDAHQDGDFLISSGLFNIYAGGKVLNSGKFVAVHKMEDGKWKVFYDIYN